MNSLDHDRDGRPWLYSTAADLSPDNVARALDYRGAVSVLSAASWDSDTDLFSEVATNFPLPDYFGHNWDALDECVFTESLEGRLVVIRDLSEAGEPNLARFVDLFEFVWLPEPIARESYPSLFDDHWQPGRVAVVVTGHAGQPIVAAWPSGTLREHHPTPLTADGAFE